MREKEAIELGKIWMRNSINKGHDFNHASEVEKHGLAILEELQKSREISLGVDKNLVSLAAWWHDAYKSRVRGFSLWAYFFEGYEAQKLVRRELSEYVEKDRLNTLLEGIRMHNHFFLYFMISGNYPSLTQILVEADNIEATSEDRFVKSFSSLGSKLSRFGHRVYLYVLLFWLRRMPLSGYMKNYLSKFK